MTTSKLLALRQTLGLSYLKQAILNVQSLQLKMLYSQLVIHSFVIEELKGAPKFNEYLTMRHDFQDQFDVGDVGAAFFAETDLFAFFRL